MHSVNLILTDAAAERLEKRARLARVDSTSLAQELLVAQLEVDSFPDGELGRAIDALRDVLMSLPGASDWRWSGIDHRHWWVSFSLAPSVECHQAILSSLAAFLNTDVLQSWGFRPFTFTPEFGADDSGEIRWQLQSLVSMVDPREVAGYLRGRLPASPSDIDAWKDFKPVI